jgi:hypothetical protein
MLTTGSVSPDPRGAGSSCPTIGRELGIARPQGHRLHLAQPQGSELRPARPPERGLRLD